VLGRHERRRAEHQLLGGHRPVDHRHPRFQSRTHEQRSAGAT
jgi:hypothetical protein